VAKTPFSISRFFWLFIAWWLTWAGVQAWMLFGFGYSLRISVIDSVVTNALLAACCVLITNILQYYLPRQERYWYILVLSSLLSALWLLLVTYGLPYLVQEEGDYYIFLTRSLPVRFGVAFLLTACMAMISVVWYTFEEQKAAEKRKTETEKLSKEAELYKLRQQLQPHFLFNSLNSINALIGTKPGEARKMIQQLSDFLRGTLKKEENQWVPLQEELQQLELYLAIEKVRFGNRLTTHFSIADETLSLRVPAMLLQPVVENAIKFGLYDTLGETNISINIKQENGILMISVQNPFDPVTSVSKPGTGFGLNSIQRRLYLLFARGDLLNTSSVDNLFTTTLKIPQPA
jgi:two-component system, LytTR family, sensor kinase